MTKAFTDGQLACLQGAVRSFHAGVVAQFPQPELTYDDVLALFATPAAAKALKAASPYVALDSIGVGMRLAWWGDRFVDLYSRGSHLLPGEPVLNHNVDRFQRIDEWVLKRDTLNIEFGRIIKLLETLQYECKSAKQVRYVFPGVIALANKAGGMEPFIAGILEPTKNPPELTHDTRLACRKAAGAIAMAQLMAERPAKTITERPSFVLTVRSRSVLPSGETAEINRSIDAFESLE